MNSVIRFFFPNFYGILFWLLLIGFFGISYKYDRQLFYRGDYEITYDIIDLPDNHILSKIRKGTSNNSKFGKQYRIYNSGHKIYPQFILNIKNHPYHKISFSKNIFPVGCGSYNYDPLSTDVQFRYFPNETSVIINNLKPCSMVQLTVISESSLDPNEWKYINTNFVATGSVLEENPIKVSQLSKAQDFFKGFLKIFKIVEGWKIIENIIYEQE